MFLLKLEAVVDQEPHSLEESEKWMERAREAIKNALPARVYVRYTCLQKGDK